MKSKLRNLPPLEVGQAYVAADFSRFDYLAATLTGSAPIVRLHLKNGTTIDLPASEADLKHLAIVLTDAFGPYVIEHLKERGWV